LLDRQMAQQQEALTEVRRSAVGSGDRSEKVRTYNYPEGRITDHRIDFKYYKLPQFVEAGDLDPVIDRLIAWDQANRLSEPPNGARAGAIPGWRARVLWPHVEGDAGGAHSPAVERAARRAGGRLVEGPSGEAPDRRPWYGQRCGRHFGRQSRPGSSHRGA